MQSYTSVEFQPQTTPLPPSPHAFTQFELNLRRRHMCVDGKKMIDYWKNLFLLPLFKVFSATITSLNANMFSLHSCAVFPLWPCCFVLFFCFCFCFWIFYLTKQKNITKTKLNQGRLIIIPVSSTRLKFCLFLFCFFVFVFVFGYFI